MNNKFLAYWLFYPLGLAFWLISRNTQDLTILCVFYSVFAGTVWGVIPNMIEVEIPSPKFLIPPFLLVMLMMLSVRITMFMTTEVVLLTAMSLVHLRAFIFSFFRLKKRAQIFSWIQLGSFLFGMSFIFQKNILPFAISRSVFLMCMLLVSSLSIVFLIIIKRKNKLEVIST